LKRKRNNHQHHKRKKDESRKFAKIAENPPPKVEVKPQKIPQTIGHCKTKSVCTKTSDEIKEEEEYYRVTCSEKCSLEFHKPCWLKFLRENKEKSHVRCPTPDCDGFVGKTIRYSKDLNTDQMTSSTQEYSIPIIEKPKKEVIKKEQPKKKEEKIPKKVKEVKEVKEIKKEEVKIEEKTEMKTEIKILSRKDPDPQISTPKEQTEIKATSQSSNLDTDKILEELKKKKRTRK